MRRWHLWAAIVAAVGSITIVACKGDQARTDATACERAYAVCPDVQPASSEDITACAHTLDGRCGTTMRRYLQCAAGKCDDAGVIDDGALESECGASLDAYRDCAASDAGSGGSSPEPVTTDAGAADAQ